MISVSISNKFSRSSKIYLLTCCNVVVIPGPITVTADLVLQSTGAVAEYQGNVLGLYRQVAGRHNGRVYYQQMDSVTEGYYLYWNKKWNAWFIEEIDGLGSLRNIQDTDLPPSQGINGSVNNASFISLL